MNNNSSEDDILSFLMGTFGMTNDIPKQEYKEPHFMREEYESGLMKKVYDGLHEYAETCNKNGLLKAQFYLNRLIGEHDGR